MANERTYPCLPCRDLDQAIAFYREVALSDSERERFQEELQAADALERWLIEPAAQRFN